MNKGMDGGVEKSMSQIASRRPKGIDLFNIGCDDVLNLPGAPPSTAASVRRHCGPYWPGKHPDSFLRVGTGMRNKDEVWAMIEINTAGRLLDITGYYGYLVPPRDVLVPDRPFLFMTYKVGVIERRGKIWPDLAKVFGCGEMLQWDGKPVGSLPHDVYRWAKEFCSPASTQRALGWMRAGSEYAGR